MRDVQPVSAAAHVAGPFSDKMGRGAQRRARGRWLLAALIVGIVLVACALPALVLVACALPALAQGELHCRQLR